MKHLTFLTIALLLAMGILAAPLFAGEGKTFESKSDVTRVAPEVKTTIPPDTVKIPFDVAPVVIEKTRIQPTYPEAAKKDGIVGKVLVKAYINKKGDVESVKLDKVEPAGKGFEVEALKVVPKWKFEPAKAKGEVVAVWVTIPIDFKLK
jgi:TonB family protein